MSLPETRSLPTSMEVRDAEEGEAGFEALLIAGRAGDRSALDRLIRTFQEPVLRLLLVRGHSLHDADDLAQDVFLNAIRTLDRFRGDERQFLRWLKVIARNQSIDHRRRAGSLKKRTDRYEDVRVQEWAALLRDKLRVSGMEAGIDFTRLCERMSETDQRIAMLRFVERKKPREIAEVLGIRGGTVRMRLSRIRTKMEEWYGRYRSSEGKA